MSEEILLHRDLIVRLRDYVNIIDDYDLAANAIEELEGMLREQIREKMQFFWQKIEQEKEITRLLAENEKSRDAVAAERERCAKIAERYLSNNEPVRLTASSIAAAIRESGDE